MDLLTCSPEVHEMSEHGGGGCCSNAEMVESKHVTLIHAEAQNDSKNYSVCHQEKQTPKIAMGRSPRERHIAGKWITLDQRKTIVLGAVNLS